MLKGSMRAAAIVVAVVATMLAGFAGTASASAPTPNRVTTNVVFDNTGTLVLSFLAQDFLAGDCYIFGPTSGQIAQVILTRPDAAGHNSIRWLAYVGTSFTHNRDIWHLNWRFRDAFGTVLGSYGQIDGPPMRPGNLYLVDRSQAGTMDPELWPLIKTVEWTGAC